MTTATDFIPATAAQKKEIRRNSAWKEDIKEEWVQWVTADNSKTSLNDITFDQANMIIAKQTGQPQMFTTSDNWALFDNKNTKHRRILALARTAQWVVKHPKYGEVADLERISQWLKSERSPVKKPLLKMDVFELSKVIKAFDGIVDSIYS